MEQQRRSRPEHKLERFRGLFFQLGLTLSLAVVWTAFEWSQPEQHIEVEPVVTVEWMEPVIPMTRPKELKPKVVQKIDPIVTPDPHSFNKTDLLFLPTLNGIDDIGDSIQVIRPIDETEIFTFVEVEMMPQFDACKGVSLDLAAQKSCFEQQLQSELKRNFKYPQRSIMVQEQGVVWLEFVVNAHGEFVDIVVGRGVGPDLDAEAVRALSRIQSIEPARIGGRPVAVKYVIPLHAILQ